MFGGIQQQTDLDLELQLSKSAHQRHLSSALRPTEDATLTIKLADAGLSKGVRRPEGVGGRLGGGKVTTLFLLLLTSCRRTLRSGCVFTESTHISI